MSCEICGRFAKDHPAGIIRKFVCEKCAGLVCSVGVIVSIKADSDGWPRKQHVHQIEGGDGSFCGPLKENV